MLLFIDVDNIPGVSLKILRGLFECEIRAVVCGNNAARVDSHINRLVKDDVVPMSSIERIVVEPVPEAADVALIMRAIGEAGLGEKLRETVVLITGDRLLAGVFSNICGKLIIANCSGSCPIAKGLGLPGLCLPSLPPGYEKTVREKGKPSKGYVAHPNQKTLFQAGFRCPNSSELPSKDFIRLWLSLGEPVDVVPLTVVTRKMREINIRPLAIHEEKRVRWLMSHAKRGLGTMTETGFIFHLIRIAPRVPNLDAGDE